MTGLSATAVAPLPDWLPAKVRLYLSHTEDGVPLRALAREVGLNASTVLRQVRRFECRRDDPLMDGALEALARAARSDIPDPSRKDASDMTAPIRNLPVLPDEAQLEREGRRVLRRLVEPGAVLAFAPEMEKAAVLRSFPMASRRGRRCWTVPSRRR